MGVAMSVTSSLFSIAAQNQAIEAQGLANQQTARNYVTSMNYTLQNLEQERRDSFEAAIDELEKIKLQGNRQESSVSAAVNEGITGGGRTASLIKRAAEADTNRATASVKSNYRNKSNEIDLNKESALLNAKRQIGSIQEVEAPSMLTTLVGLAGSYYTAKNTDEQIEAMRVKNGVTSYTQSDKAYSFDYDTLFGNTFLSSPSQHFNFDYYNPFLTQGKVTTSANRYF